MEASNPTFTKTTRAKPIYGAKHTTRGNAYSQRNFIKKKVFVSTHNVNTTKEYISNTVEEICGSPPVSCVQLRTKYNSYVSFCITVTEASYVLLLDPTQWEEDFLIMPFEGKGRYIDRNTKTTTSHPREVASAPSNTQEPNSEAACSDPTGSKQSIDLADLRRQNKELERQLKELHSAWDADNESIPSSPSSLHNTSAQSLHDSDQLSTVESAINTQNDLNHHLSLEEGNAGSNHSTPEEQT